MIFHSFKQSFKLAPAVLKNTSLYFGIYFFVFSALLLALFQKLSDSNISSLESFPFSKFFNQGMLFLAGLFIAFIIPYYTFKYSQGLTPKFWDFIKNNIWTVVLNHIKAIFVILLYCLPAIVILINIGLKFIPAPLTVSIPLIVFFIILPIYKSVRFTFLTETVFFDKQDQRSYLKQADSNTQGYFWKIILFFILLSLLNLISYGFTSLLSSILGSSFFTTFLSLILFFYLQCFLLLWRVRFFFEIKKQKGEEISC